tara:strand:- start:3598 stop:3888 length:291 start_codon:yes stop_codon:yes gene_type:complete
MALDFPGSPTNGQTFLGSNGINYIYDETDGKWEVYNDPGAGSNVWSRDPVNAVLLPVYNGDGVKLQNPSGTTTINLQANGTITAEAIDIDSFDALP